jgi:hypothetical protein
MPLRVSDHIEHAVTKYQPPMLDACGLGRGRGLYPR